MGSAKPATERNTLFSRLFLEFEKEILNLSAKMPKQNIYYSDKYEDEKFEYRHVMLPKDLAKMVPKTHLMSETEWRNLGVQQSQGWVHYMTHDPEPHILLFRRPTAIYGANQNQNQAPNQQN